MTASAVTQLRKLQEQELALGLAGTTASWHEEFRSSAAVCLRGLDVRLTEGDILAVLSQFGEPVDLFVPRVRNNKGQQSTGRSGQQNSSQLPAGSRRGFAFCVYEDQRSTDLAVDNLSGHLLLGRVLSCEHVKDFKVPEDDVRAHAMCAEEMQREALGLPPKAAGDDELGQRGAGGDNVISLRSLGTEAQRKEEEEQRRVIAYTPMTGEGDDDTSDPAGSSSDTRESGGEEGGLVPGASARLQDRERRHRHRHHRRHRGDGRKRDKKDKKHARSAHHHHRRRHGRSAHGSADESSSGRDDERRRSSRRARHGSPRRRHGGRNDGRGDVMDPRAIFAELEQLEKEGQTAPGAEEPAPQRSATSDSAATCSNCHAAGHQAWECTVPHQAPSLPPRSRPITAVPPKGFVRPTWQSISEKRRAGEK